MENLPKLDKKKTPTDCLRKQENRPRQEGWLRNIFSCHSVISYINLCKEQINLEKRKKFKEIPLSACESWAWSSFGSLYSSSRLVRLLLKWIQMFTCK